MTDARTAARWDHDRDERKHELGPRHQRRAVSALVGYCTGLIGEGILSPEIEQALRTRIRTVCVEFDMDPPVERARVPA